MTTTQQKGEPKSGPEIVLHQAPPAFGVQNPSPFCLKLETWLRLAELPFRIKKCRDPRKGPKGKIPFIEIEGTVLGDSEHIIETLSDRFGVDLDKGLNPADRAAGHAFRRMFEEHLYWILVYSRWLEDEPFEVLNKAFFSKLPPVLRSIVPVVAKRSLRKTLHAHGLGRHTPKQIYAKAEQDLQAASDFLGDKPFFLGKQPRTVDASAFGVLTGMIDATLKTPLTPIAAKFENLTAYTSRMNEHAYANRAATAA